MKYQNHYSLHGVYFVVFAGLTTNNSINTLIKLPLGNFAILAPNLFTFNKKVLAPINVVIIKTVLLYGLMGNTLVPLKFNIIAIQVCLTTVSGLYHVAH